MLLAPPLWATGTWVDDTWADGSWATEITAPADFGDLTTLFVGYVGDLRDANPLRVDSTTLVAKDLATVIAGTSERADRNTQYCEYLS
jgi:hypothetical protein